MTEQELLTAPYYFCDLKTGDLDCPKKETCKRYANIKDIPYKDYHKYGFARLIHICNESNYKMYLKVDDIPNEDGNNKIEEQ